MNPEYLQSHKEGVVLAVHVSPNAAKTKIAGVHGNELKIQLNAPPVEGKANKELLQFLSKFFHLPKNRVVLLNGETSRSKKILLEGKLLADVIMDLQEFIG